jgi:D-aspartate ligase
MSIRIRNTSTPAVVLNVHNHGPLGIARSLGRLGIPVYATHCATPTPGVFSRYIREKMLWKFPGGQSDQAIDALLEFGRRIGRRSIIYPITDELTWLVMENIDRLREWFIYPQQTLDLINTLADKKNMYFLARQHNIPTPKAAFPQSIADIRDFAKQATYPVMLKGIQGEKLNRRTGKKMQLVRNEQELLESYIALEDPAEPNLMLQEYIPGGDDTIWMFNGYFDRNSDCLFSITGQKLRQAPPYGGVTSLGICLPNAAVEQTTKRFMKAVGYQGILDIGYRYDARDGEFKVLDINPRIGASFRLFLGHNGLDVALALYLDLTGQPVPPSHMREGRKWWVEDLDLKSFAQYYRDGNITIADFLSSFSGVEEAAYFAADDLRPFWKMCTDIFSRLPRSTFVKTRQKVAAPQTARERP